jgi:hypothetical protein
VPALATRSCSPTRLLIATDLLELADPAFRAELSGFVDLAGTAPEPRLRYAALARRAMIALLGGQLAEAERLIGSRRGGRDCGDPGADDVRTDRGWDLMSARVPAGRAGQGRGGHVPRPGLHPGPRPARVLLARGDRPGPLVVAPELAIGGPGGPPPRRRVG